MQSKSFTGYALLGSGRMARHLRHYLQHLQLPVRCWSRNADPQFNDLIATLDADLRLEQTLAACSHVLLAVKDEALFELSQRALPGQTVVHFAGALSLASAQSAHPLMTFGERLEPPDWYKCIPFVVDEGRELKNLLPGLPNPYFALAPNLRPYYHALCSLAGNSTFLLWKQVGDEFERTLNLPRALLSPFLHQVVANSSRFSAVDFTGPVARGDWDVVRSHLQSLRFSPKLLEAYRHYLSAAESAGHTLPEAL